MTCGRWLAFVTSCTLVARLVAAEPFSIQWVGSSPGMAVEVAGFPPAVSRTLESPGRSPEDWARLLAVFAEQAEAVAHRPMPPMLGAWRFAAGRLRFEPRFPLERGVRYRVEFRPAVLGGELTGAQALTSFFELPAAAAVPATTVVQVFPTAGVLPENQLKFYVQFSAAMRGGAIYDHIKIRDADGRAIDLPFLEVDEELWNPAMTRLTLLIDPGRIKRGVKPLVDIGPVFEEGKSYTLTIDAAWRDAAGQPLRETYRREIRIGAPDRTPPDPMRWKIRAPGKETREPLTVAFDEPMDQALALRMIAVADARGSGVAGEAALAGGEREWIFVPEQAWRPGAYQIVVPTTIEDLAGNNIGKVFDVDLFENVQRRIATTSVKVAFEVK